jgi:iron complex transport system permease protein
VTFAARAGLVVVVAGLGLAAAATAQLALGEPRLGPGRLVALLADGPAAADARQDAAFVVWQLRLPRLAVAVLAGAALAVGGHVLQDSLRKPLAGPELLGVGLGASLVVAIVTVFGIGLPPALLPLAALAGGLAAGALVLGAARGMLDPVRTLLLGAALTSLLSAVLVGVLTLAADTMVQDAVLRYLTGSVSGVTWRDAAVAAPWVAVGLACAFAAARTLNLLRLGDDVAGGLGLRVDRARLVLLVLAAALVAPAVAVTGPIAFVSLLAPHAARLALGTGDVRRVLPATALLGALVVVLADAAGRLVLFPLELPAGAWTVLLGGPLVLVLLRRLRATGSGAG